MNAEERREARRKRILQNSESRLRKITTLRTNDNLLDIQSDTIKDEPGNEKNSEKSENSENKTLNPVLSDCPVPKYNLDIGTSTKHLLDLLDTLKDKPGNEKNSEKSENSENKTLNPVLSDCLVPKYNLDIGTSTKHLLDLLDTLKDKPGNEKNSEKSENSENKTLNPVLSDCPVPKYNLDIGTSTKHLLDLLDTLKDKPGNEKNSEKSENSENKTLNPVLSDCPVPKYNLDIGTSTKHLLDLLDTLKDKPGNEKNSEKSENSENKTLNPVLSDCPVPKYNLDIGTSTKHLEEKRVFNFEPKHSKNVNYKIKCPSITILHIILSQIVLVLFYYDFGFLFGNSIIVPFLLSIVPELYTSKEQHDSIHLVALLMLGFSQGSAKRISRYMKLTKVVVKRFCIYIFCYVCSYAMLTLMNFDFKQVPEHDKK